MTEHRTLPDLWACFYCAGIPGICEKAGPCRCKTDSSKCERLSTLKKNPLLWADWCKRFSEHSGYIPDIQSPFY